MSDLAPGVDWAYIADVVAKIKTRFPAYAFLLDNPEIAQTLIKGIQEEWTPDTFSAQLKATDWWKSTNDAQRQAQALEATNPGETTKKVNALKQQIVTTAGALGGGMDDATAGGIAWQAFRNGWTDDEIRQAVAARSPNVPGKEAINVDQYTAAYMVDADPAQKLEWARQLNTGKIDAATFELQLREAAKSRFPSLAEYLDKGIRPQDFFAPYKQLIGNMIGRTADQVDLMKDPNWMKVISTADPKTGTLRPMTMDETTKLVRSSNDFLGSANGQAEAASFVTDLGKAIGATK